MTDNNTTNTLRVKTCASGNDCKHQHGPDLPEYDFYTRHGKSYKICKECHKSLVNKKPVLHKSEPGDSGEMLVINKLRSLGIYAAPGKSSEYKWVDVVAWGCIRIEVKTAAATTNGAFHFGMGNKPKKEKERSDFVILVCIDNEITYHVFKSNHAVFYHEDGRSKKSVQYAPDTRHRWSRAGLDNEIMARHMDAWDQIEDRRQEIIGDMLDNYDEPESIELQSKPEQVRLTDSNSQQIPLF